jgi:hypothetical protein
MPLQIQGDSQAPRILTPPHPFLPSPHGTHRRFTSSAGFTTTPPPPLAIRGATS